MAGRVDWFAAGLPREGRLAHVPRVGDLARRDVPTCRLDEPIELRRNVPVKNFKTGGSEPAAGGTVRRVITIQEGIPIEAAREIVKYLKDKKLKRVQAAIQGDQVRVSSPSKDDLQEAIRALREHDFGVALQFGNYR